MTFLKSFCGCLLILFLFGGCSTALHVDKLKDFQFDEKHIKRMVSISPNFQLIEYKQSLIGNVNNKFRDLNNVLVDNAQSNGVYLEIIDAKEIENNDISYFNFLAPLKKEIIQKNFLQDFVILNRKDEDKEDIGRILTLYEKGPLISSHYSHLAEMYGTPYFAIHGVTLRPKNILDSRGFQTPFEALMYEAEEDKYETLYYNIIADVSKGQIVYREYRKVSLNISNSNLNSIIYDSFKILSR